MAQRSLDLAEKLVQDNQARVEVGTMAPIDVVQAQAEAATRRQALGAGRSDRRTAELALKRLIVGGTEDPTVARPRSTRSIGPMFRPEPVDLEGAVRRALSERTDIEQSRKKQSKPTTSTLRYLQDQTLPAGRPRRRATASRASAARSSSAGHGARRHGHGTIPGGYVDALAHAVRPRLPALEPRR